MSCCSAGGRRRSHLHLVGARVQQDGVLVDQLRALLRLRQRQVGKAQPRRPVFSCVGSHCQPSCGPSTDARGDRPCSRSSMSCAACCFGASVESRVQKPSAAATRPSTTRFVRITQSLPCGSRGRRPASSGAGTPSWTACCSRPWCACPESSPPPPCRPARVVHTFSSQTNGIEHHRAGASHCVMHAVNRRCRIAWSCSRLELLAAAQLRRRRARLCVLAPAAPLSLLRVLKLRGLRGLLRGLLRVLKLRGLLMRAVCPHIQLECGRWLTMDTLANEQVDVDVSGVSERFPASDERLLCVCGVRTVMAAWMPSPVSGVNAAF